MICGIINHSLAASFKLTNHSRYALVIKATLQLTSNLCDLFLKNVTARADLFLKYNVDLRTLLQGLSEYEFYDDLVYKFRLAKLIFPYNLKNCHSLQKDRLQFGYSAANCMHGCYSYYG